MSCMSDSWIDAKPRIEEPSNIWPTVKNSSSTVDAGMLKCCCTPGRSVKRMSRNLTFVSLMNFSTSDESRNMRVNSKRRGCGSRSVAHCGSLEISAAALPVRDAYVSHMLQAGRSIDSVSYTHLTLPTIYSV